MPYKNKADRKYKRAEDYEDSPAQVKNREKRNAARKALMKEGRLHKNDGLEADHIKPLSKGGGGGKKNLRVRTASENRSFSRNADHSVKRNTPKK